MNITCSKCGHENAMGAIFCRSCGAKLEMSGISHDKLQKESKDEKKTGNRKKILRDAACWGALILVLALLEWSMFSLSGLKQYSAPSVDAKRFSSLYERMSGDVPPRQASSFEFSVDEINHFIETKLVPTLYGGLDVEHVDWETSPSGQTVRIYAKFLGQNTIFQLDGRMTCRPEADNPVAFKVEDIKIGRLPVLFKEDYFLEKLTPILENDLIRNSFKHVKSAEFTPQGIRITLNPPPAPPAAAENPDAPTATPEQQKQEQRRAAEREKNKQRFRKTKAAPKTPANMGFKMLQRDTLK